MSNTNVRALKSAATDWNKENKKNKINLKLKRGALIQALEEKHVFLDHVGVKTKRPYKPRMARSAEAKAASNDKRKRTLANKRHKARKTG
jgi:hypothetical protein